MLFPLIVHLYTLYFSSPIFPNLEHLQHSKSHIIQPLEVAQNEKKKNNIFFLILIFQMQFSTPLASFPKAHLFYPMLCLLFFTNKYTFI